MQDYIAELEQDYIAELDAYLKASNLDDTELTDEEKEVLKGPDKTKEFKIEELFESANGDTDLKKSDLTDTGLPLITSGLSNNGIAGLTVKPARVFDGHTITVDMFGNAFYRDTPYKMVTHARVFALLPHGWKMTEKTGLYLTGQLCHFKEFFSYSNMCSFKKIKRMTISLPVTSTGTPDWHFMETYITAIEKLTIKDIVKYKNQMIKTTKQVVNC